MIGNLSEWIISALILSTRKWFLSHGNHLGVLVDLPINMNERRCTCLIDGRDSVQKCSPFCALDHIFSNYVGRIDFFDLCKD